MKKLYASFLPAATALLLAFMIAGGASAQTKVVIPGTFQSELGCTSDQGSGNGDWEPNCDFTALSYSSSTGLWTGTFLIPAGCQQYKVAIDGSWGLNYGENGVPGGANIQLYVPQPTMITFTYDPWSHMVTTSPIASGFSPNCLPQVVLAGSFQSEVGCAGDWDPSCTNTALTYNTSSGLFEGDFTIPNGCYEYRVVLNNDWVNNFGQWGQTSGTNYILSIPAHPATVHFTYDPVSHIVQSLYNSNVCRPDKVVLAGSFQSELGCSGDWVPDCNNSELLFNPESGFFEGDLMVPKGCYEYRIVLNGSWATNFGQYGMPDGPNYVLSLPVKDDKVHFLFNPDYNVVTSSYSSNVCQPGAVVIAGSFQSELGCAGDWMPDCDNSRLNYDPGSGMWVDTFYIPAGRWEYKVTINNSWDENYGLYGVPGGENIPLELCYPARVIFSYNHEYHYVNTQIITNGICLTKVYDPNVNSYPDEGEKPMEGVSFTLTGNGITQVQTTGSKGKAAFTGLPNGAYWIKETVPQGYLSTGQDSQIVYIYNGLSTVYFGNVCLGAGPGGVKGMGFWTSKNGEAALRDAGKMEYALMELRNLNLRNADGSDFDPATYDQFRAWLKGANAKNMVYMVSAQLAVFDLNQSMGYIDAYNSILYTGSCYQVLYSKFMSSNALISYTNYYLWVIHSSTGNDPYRTYLECLKNVLERANNNLNFVQPEPCGVSAIAINPAVKLNAAGVISEARIWPNPSSRFFTLRPATGISNEPVTVNVFDVNGKKLYRATGSANQDYRIGDAFVPGIYFVELMQGSKRSTFKLVKQ